MRADDIRKDQMRYKEIEPNGISQNSTAFGHDQPLWLPLVFVHFDVRFCVVIQLIVVNEHILFTISYI